MRESSMDAFQKVLVVDDGERTADWALSAELAELGFASVTTSLEATEDVLKVIPRPAAILLQLPSRKPGSQHDSFLELAQRLRASDARIPVIVVDGAASQVGSYASILQDQFRSRAVAKPEL